MQETERRAREMSLRFLRDGSETDLGRMICSAILSQTDCAVHEIRAGMEVMQEFVADYPKGQRDLEALQELVATLETERPPVSKELSENEQEVAGKLGLTPEEYRHGKR